MEEIESKELVVKNGGDFAKYLNGYGHKGTKIDKVCGSDSGKIPWQEQMKKAIEIPNLVGVKMIVDRVSQIRTEGVRVGQTWIEDINGNRLSDEEVLQEHGPDYRVWEIEGLTIKEGWGLEMIEKTGSHPLLCCTSDEWELHVFPGEKEGRIIWIRDQKTGYGLRFQTGYEGDRNDGIPARYLEVLLRLEQIDKEKVEIGKPEIEGYFDHLIELSSEARRFIITETEAGRLPEWEKRPYVEDGNGGDYGDYKLLTWRLMLQLVGPNGTFCHSKKWSPVQSSCLLSDWVEYRTDEWEKEVEKRLENVRPESWEEVKKKLMKFMVGGLTGAENEEFSISDPAINAKIINIRFCEEYWNIDDNGVCLKKESGEGDLYSVRYSFLK